MINVAIGESKICYFYKIESPSGKVYIGSTIDFNRRMRQYKNMYHKGQTKLYNSFLKYGFENHKITIIDTFNAKYRNLLENFYCIKYDVLGVNGLNCSIPKIKDSVCVSDETRFKISEANKGRTLSIESKNKIRQSNIGKKASYLTIEKMKQSHLNKDKSIYIQISRKLKGKSMSKEFCANHSKRIMKKVFDSKTGYIYESIQEAALKNNIKYSTLVSRISRNSSNNFFTLQNA